MAQLKALRGMITEQGGWELSIGTGENTVIGAGDTLNFTAGSENFSITKGDKDNNVKFDLAKEITLDKITAGASTLNATGLVITGGPQITTGGINAGGKKITNVATGTNGTDAVNFAQLKELAKGWKINTTSEDFTDAIASREGSIALGLSAKASVEDGIALGAQSVANVAAGVLGYDPRTRANSNKNDIAWKSNYGAVSIGSSYITRQIVGVAAGTNDTDAVNVAQMKSLQEYVDKGWKLSVGGENSKSVGIDSAVDFSAGSTNLNITKGKDDDNVKFDLAKEITLNKITAGASTLNATGLVITGGPQITTGGIDAGGKKITNVATGTDGTDAVNFSQLKELKEQVAASSFVKQEDGTQHITIGKDTGGDKIDIANNENEKRTLTGIKAGALSADSNEAVIGSQLFETNNNVTRLKNNFSDIQTTMTGVQTNLSTIAKNTSQYLGGNADILVGKAPTYTVEGKSYNDVASAFSGVSHSFTEVKQQMTNVNNSITNVQNKITKELTNQINSAITTV